MINATSRTGLTAVLVAATFVFVPAKHGIGATLDDTAELAKTIGALDAKVFDAYNRCDMETFENFSTPAVEFYHDQGGATFDRATVIANTRKYICNKVHRKLLVETLKVYPIKNFGAIEEGEHVFCQIENGKCEGVAKFLMIWENKDGKWRINRVVSYGHRELSASEKVLPSLKLN
ncbi:nuclear transport factor 2 family protein [Undibacterium sp.]|jgi:hypothetical protein|uniref:nuclear transport factor 2 family protein n=1 Tax=Undibacterium sp. TaxID=1914977 RepID=UPI002CAB1CC5|nr:nuclear transport factor 2 family protein [Undibacterium sp.]HTD03666.1 nuclear transport factor 2 family protein [Undibacterium sp.]